MAEIADTITYINIIIINRFSGFCSRGRNNGVLLTFQQQVCRFITTPHFLGCQTTQYSDYANKLLVMFVDYASKLYEQEFLIYNAHCLMHLTDDVLRFGPLDNISCFPLAMLIKNNDNNNNNNSNNDNNKKIIF